jgi:hypothetical protein
MPTLGTAHLPEPSDWNEFEDICADLFSREWNDPNITRYGLQGERQDGVDIYGGFEGKPAGLQCKGRRNWPPRKLGTKDIDAAVAEARKFQPPLKTFNIVTTAPVGKALQDHARTVSLKHEEQGLFKVFVTGWSELYRRLTQHIDLHLCPRLAVETCDSPESECSLAWRWRLCRSSFAHPRITELPLYLQL